MFWYDKRQKRKKERRSVTKTMEIYHILLKGEHACLCWLGCLRDGPRGANTPNQPSQLSYCSPFTIHSTLT